MVAPSKQSKMQIGERTARQERWKLICSGVAIIALLWEVPCWSQSSTDRFPGLGHSQFPKSGHKLFEGLGSPSNSVPGKDSFPGLGQAEKPTDSKNFPKVPTTNPSNPFHLPVSKRSVSETYTQSKNNNQSRKPASRSTEGRVSPELHSAISEFGEGLNNWQFARQNKVLLDNAVSAADRIPKLAGRGTLVKVEVYRELNGNVGVVTPHVVGLGRTLKEASSSTDKFWSYSRPEHSQKEGVFYLWYPQGEKLLRAEYSEESLAAAAEYSEKTVQPEDAVDLYRKKTPEIEWTFPKQRTLP